MPHTNPGTLSCNAIARHPLESADRIATFSGANTAPGVSSRSVEANFSWRARKAV
jgi:hypothetical protein